MRDHSTAGTAEVDPPRDVRAILAVGPSKPATLPQIAIFCRNAGIRQMWVTSDGIDRLHLPRAIDRKAGPPAHLPFFDTDEPLRWDTSPSSPSYSPGWITVSRPPAFALVIPQWDTRNPWHTFSYLNPGSELGGQLASFYRRVGVLWTRTGALTSDALLRALHPHGIPHTEQPPPGQLGPRGEQPDGAELPWQTWRDPLDRERKASHCHVFDRRGQFLAAASSLPLGTGTPEHHPHPTFDPKIPGYWHLRWPDGRERWHATPAVRWEMVQPGAGDPPEILEAWTWPTSHQWLEKWYRTLRDARAGLLALEGYDDSHPTVKAVKAVYREGIGRLGSHRRQQTRDPLYQPYWRHAVIAEARTRLHLKIAQLGQQPVAVDVDAGLWLTDTADPHTFARRIGIEEGTGLGQWAYKGTIPGDTARDALNSRNPILELGKALKTNDQ